MDDLLLDVARAVRAAVLPHLGRPEMRGAAGVAVGGDTTFGLDALAEQAALEVLQRAGELAWYTEDRGLEVRGRPRRVIVVDPIDGTRPAGAGLESACVSVAAAPFSPDATLGDVEEGLVLELKTGALFWARRGEGVVIVADGASRRPTPSSQTSLQGAFWTYGLRGRPALASAVVLEELIDASGLRGGSFDLGSASYAMTRVVCGQLDAYVDHGQRLLHEIPALRRFEAVGGGAVLNNSPYDVAAALVICREAGVVVTDAAGRPLEDRPLLGSGPSYQVSTLAACTPQLHAALLEALDRGIAKLGKVWDRWLDGSAAAAGAGPSG